MSQTQTREPGSDMPDDGRWGPPADQPVAQLPATTPAAAPAAAPWPGMVADRDLDKAVGATIESQAAPVVHLPARVSAKITQAVANVMGELERVEKRGRNDFHRFDYATIDDMRAAVAQACSKHGLAWRQEELKVFPFGKLIGITYGFSLSCAHEPEHEAFPCKVTVLTSLLTNSGKVDDKAFSKARALAWKDWAKGQFSIATGDDPEPAGDADPDSSHGAPTDRELQRPQAQSQRRDDPRDETRREAAEAGRAGPGAAFHRQHQSQQAQSVTAGAIIAADGSVRVADSPDAWLGWWRERVRAMVGEGRFDDLRTAANRNKPAFSATARVNSEAVAEVERLIREALGTAPAQSAQQRVLNGRPVLAVQAAARDGKVSWADTVHRLVAVLPECATVDDLQELHEVNKALLERMAAEDQRAMAAFLEACRARSQELTAANEPPDPLGEGDSLYGGAQQQQAAAE